MWTAGLLGYLLDFDKPGLAKELKVKLDERGGKTGGGEKAFCYDPEALKLLLEDLCVEAGVQFQYHTRVAAAFKEGRRLTTIVTDSKSGREAWRAPVFIDTTGDGDLGALAGCAFELGEAKDCPCQPMSLNALLVVKDVEALREFVRFGKALLMRIPMTRRRIAFGLKSRNLVTSHPTANRPSGMCGATCFSP
ncbi:FAD-dependent oxidoreductase [Verrucomicrobium spinosum]|uniref:FAD-dependent oxidoreductase n=1 Tax=Verrucomicrobium spinosum TaxID=2736 RepID=UPI00210A83B8|nr:FAD-dependent oxidoreductase [Verrucomicrobium spinosum]